MLAASWPSWRLHSLTAVIILTNVKIGSATKAHPGVLRLTDADFDLSINNGTEGPWFVKFYAPWCGHCKKLGPEWEALAQKLQGKVTVAKVDVTVESKLAANWGIRGLPGLRFISANKSYTYDPRAWRTVRHLETFALEGYKTSTAEDIPQVLAHNASRVLELTQSNFDAVVKRGSQVAWFVKFYAPWCGHCKRLAPEWEDLANKLANQVRLAKVDATQQTDLSEQWGIEGFPTLKLISSGKVYSYAGGRSLEKLEAFARGGFMNDSLPELLPDERPPSQVVELTSATFNASVLPRTKSPWFLNFFLPSCGHCRTLAPDWEQLAQNLKGQVHVGKIDVAEERQLAEAWGVERFPTLKLIAGGLVYEYDGDRSVESMQEFAHGGYKSQPEERELPPYSPQEHARDWVLLAASFIAGMVVPLLVFLCTCKGCRAHSSCSSPPAGRTPTHEAHTKKDS